MLCVFGFLAAEKLIPKPEPQPQIATGNEQLFISICYNKFRQLPSQNATPTHTLHLRISRIESCRVLGAKCIESGVNIFIGFLSGRVGGAFEARRKCICPASDRKRLPAWMIILCKCWCLCMGSGVPGSLCVCVCVPAPVCQDKRRNPHEMELFTFNCCCSSFSAEGELGNLEKGKLGMGILGGQSNLAGEECEVPGLIMKT